MRKFRIAIQLVLAASLLAGCTAVEQTSNTPSNITPSVTVVTMTPTVSPTIKPSFTPTETLVPSMTPTPTEAPEAKLIEWDNAELNINGQPVEFVMGMEESADVLSLWSQWGIKRLTINKEMKGDYKNKFSKLIEASLWQASINGGSMVSFDEFLANSDKYPISFTEPNDSGGFLDVHFFLEDIKRVEWRYVNTNDPRLFFLNPTLGPKVGYKRKTDGTFIVYSAPIVDDNMMNILLGNEFKEYRGNLLPYMVGDTLGGLTRHLLEMSNTTSLYSQGESPESQNLRAVSGGFEDELNKVESVSGYPSIAGMKAVEGSTTNEAGAKYFRDYGFWKAIMQ
jgi:hypothetical protein